jgi:hypothetical protein
MKLDELFTPLMEKTNLEEYRKEVEVCVKDFLLKVLRATVEGKMDPMDDHFVNTITRAFTSYLRPTFDKLVKNYPFEYKDVNGEIRKIPQSWYEFKMKTTEEIAAEYGEDTVFNGNFYGAHSGGSLVVGIQLAIPDFVVDGNFWNQSKTAGKDAFKEKMLSAMKQVSNSFVHEANHYRQYQQMGWKWIENILNTKNRERSVADHLTTSADDYFRYMLNDQEIDSFALNIVGDIIYAMRAGEIKDVPQAKKLLSTRDGIAHLSDYSPRLGMYHEAFTDFINPRNTVYWRKDAKKARIAKNFYSRLMKKIIFHLDNYVANEEKTIRDLEAAKKPIAQVRAVAKKIGTFIKTLMIADQ